MKEPEKGITIANIKPDGHVSVIGCGSEETSMFISAIHNHPEIKVIVLGGDVLEKPPTTWKASPFEPEPFIISSLPKLEEPFFPKGLDNRPWYDQFTNKKRRKH